MGYLGDFVGVLTSPKSFFVEEANSDDSLRALKFAAISILTAAIFKAASVHFSSQFVGSLASASAAVKFGSALVTPLFTVGISLVIAHILVVMMGKSGFTRTVNAYLYGTALAPITGILSLVLSPLSSAGSSGMFGKGLIMGLVGFITAIYVLYIQIRAIEGFHQLDTSQATIVGVITFIGTGIFIFVLSMLLAIIGMAAIMAANPAAPTGAFAGIP